MTDEQKKYRAGQIVHVRVRTCYSGPDSDGDILITRNAEGSWGSIYIPAADIVSVEPEPLKVGDLVRRPDWSSETKGGEILAINDDAAWLKFSDGTFTTTPLSDLVRA